MPGLNPSTGRQHPFFSETENQGNEFSLGLTGLAWGGTRNRHFAFGLFLLVSLTAYWRTVSGLVQVALHYDYCSQIAVIPLLSAALVYWQRRRIFQETKNNFGMGAVILSFGLAIDWLALHYGSALGSYNSLSLKTLSLVLIWVAGFCAIYGTQALRAATFPLAFLVLTIPIPTYGIEKLIFYLQSGSTAIANQLFVLVGVPVYRQGFLLSLPGLTIEVAEECRSIRSSLALLITCLLFCYCFLRYGWRRTALVLLALPLSVFKNGVRIVTLSLLSIYVNPAFMKSDLHRDGGILFYLLALLILYPVFRWFEKSESRSRPRETQS